jgi:hypothetical protein
VSGRWDLQREMKQQRDKRDDESVADISFLHETHLNAMVDSVPMKIMEWEFNNDTAQLNNEELVIDPKLLSRTRESEKSAVNAKEFEFRREGRVVWLDERFEKDDQVFYHLNVDEMNDARET